MTTNPQALRPVKRKLERIHSRAWEHPADRAALSALRQIPGFDEALKKIVSIFGERGMRLIFRADAVRVGPRQFPRLHRLWLNVHDTLDVQEEYELFVTQYPIINAGAYGIDKPWVVLTSESLRSLSDDEIEFVMGHEMGHVVSGHALYHTMLQLILMFAMGSFGILGMITLPIRLALLEWYRKSELSCDRAGLLATQLPDAAMGAMMRMAAGGSRDETDLYEFLKQAEEYRQAGNFLDELMKTLNQLFITHPFLTLRAALIRDWIEEGGYDRVIGGDYPRRDDDGKPTDWVEDIGEGVRHYTTPLQDAAGKAGDAMRKVKDAFERGFERGSKPKDD